MLGFFKIFLFAVFINSSVSSSAVDDKTDINSRVSVFGDWEPLKKAFKVFIEAEDRTAAQQWFDTNPPFITANNKVSVKSLTNPIVAFRAWKASRASGPASAEDLAAAAANAVERVLKDAGIDALPVPNLLQGTSSATSTPPGSQQGSPQNPDKVAEHELRVQQLSETLKQHAEQAKRDKELAAAGGGGYTDPAVQKLSTDIASDEKVKFHKLECNDATKTVKFSGQVSGVDIPPTDYVFADAIEYQRFKTFLNVMKATRSNNFAAVGDAMAGIFTELFSGQGKIDPARLKELKEMQDQLALGSSMLSGNSARSTVSLPFADHLQLSYQTNDEFTLTKASSLGSFSKLLEDLSKGRVYTTQPKFKQFVDALQAASKYSLVPEFQEKDIWSLLQDIGLLLPFNDNRDSRTPNMRVAFPAPYDDLDKYCTIYAEAYSNNIGSVIPDLPVDGVIQPLVSKLLSPKQLVKKVFALAVETASGNKAKDIAAQEINQIVADIQDAAEKLAKEFSERFNAKRNIIKQQKLQEYLRTKKITDLNAEELKAIDGAGFNKDDPDYLVKDAFSNFKSGLIPVKTAFGLSVSKEGFGDRIMNFSPIFPALQTDAGLREAKNVMALFSTVAENTIGTLRMYQLFADTQSVFTQEFLKFTYSGGQDLNADALKEPVIIDLGKILRSNAAAQALLYLTDATATSTLSTEELKLNAGINAGDQVKTALILDALEFFSGPLLTDENDAKKPVAKDKRHAIIADRSSKIFPNSESLPTIFRLQSSKLDSREALWQFVADYLVLYPSSSDKLDTIVDVVSRRLAQKGEFKQLETALLDLAKRYSAAQTTVATAVNLLALQPDIQLPQLQQVDPVGSAVVTRVLSQLMVARNVAKKFNGTEPGMSTALDVRSNVDSTQFGRFLRTNTYYNTTATPGLPASGMNLNDSILPLQWFRVFIPAASAMETACATLQKDAKHAAAANALTELIKAVNTVSDTSGRFLEVLDQFVNKYNEFLNWKKSVTPGSNTLDIASRLLETVSLPVAAAAQPAAPSAVDYKTLTIDELKQLQSTGDIQALREMRSRQGTVGLPGSGK